MLVSQEKKQEYYELRSVKAYSFNSQIYLEMCLSTTLRRTVSQLRTIAATDPATRKTHVLFVMRVLC